MSKNKFIKGKFIKRYKRFFVDVQLDSKEIVTAHCPNTGSMMGLLQENNTVYLTKADDPKRKLKYTLEIIQSNKANVGVNTHKANRIVEEALISQSIRDLGKITSYKREVKYGKNSRIDFLIMKNKEQIYLEVKNVTLSRKNGLAEFPDAVTERGLKHLLELANLKEKNTRKIMFFLIQRDDCEKFQIASDIDPNYFKAFKKAKKMGVEMISYDCSFGNDNISVNNRVNLIIE